MDDALDVVLLMMVLVIFIPIMVLYTTPLLNGNVGGFDTQIEKTALKSSGEIVPVKKELRSEDVLLMFVVADEYTPSPEKIQINIDSPSEVFELDDNFLQNKRQTIIKANTALPAKEKVKVELYVNDTGMRKWVVTRD